MVCSHQVLALIAISLTLSVNGEYCIFDGSNCVDKREGTRTCRGDYGWCYRHVVQC